MCTVWWEGKARKESLSTKQRILSDTEVRMWIDRGLPCRGSKIIAHLGYGFIDMIVGFCALIGKEKLAFSLDFLTILFRFNSHTIMSTHFNCTIQVFFLKIYSELCNYHCYLISEHFHHPTKKLLYPLTVILHSFPHSPSPTLGKCYFTLCSYSV